jgi:hypothetical protein
MNSADPIDDLRYLVGCWEAQVENPASVQKLRLKYTVEPTLDGRWLTGFGTSPDVPVSIRDMWGRNAITGEIVRGMFDSQGTYGIVRSPGWAGDTLILEGDANASVGVVRVRETISRVGPDEFRAVWEALQRGTWTAYSIERLVRAK